MKSQHCDEREGETSLFVAREREKFPNFCLIVKSVFIYFFLFPILVNFSLSISAAKCNLFLLIVSVLQKYLLKCSSETFLFMTLRVKMYKK